MSFDFKPLKIGACIALAAALTGGITGVAAAVFGRVLLAIGSFRDAHFIFLIPFLAPVGALIAFLYKRFGKSSVKGMGLVFAAAENEDEDIPARLIPFVAIGTWLTHLFGGSAGREGVAVQIGAAVGRLIRKLLPFENISRIMIVSGMAAGFSGLFRTPFAAVFFALEVLCAGCLEYRALVPACIAALTAYFVSGLCGLEKFVVPLGFTLSLDLPLIVKLVGLGIIFGLVGAAFAFALERSKELVGAKFKNPVTRIAIIGLALSVLLVLLHKGRYSGLGTNLINLSFSGGTLFAYDWLLKLALTVLTLCAGFQGGEVTPLFSIGASLGVALAPIFGVPVELAAALGYAAVFGGASNTLLAPIFIGAEVFGYQYLPMFCIVCIAAYACNLNLSIYSGQKLLNDRRN